MRFLFVAVACLAVAAKVSAQLDVSSADASDYSLMENDVESSSDFDISGKMMPPSQQELPQQRHLPIKEAVKQQIQKVQQPQQQAVKTAPLQQSTLPVQQSMPIKQETIKTNTVLLQPIVLLPKRKQQTILYAPKRQHKKTFNVDVDRTLSYKVSPSIHAANSRSVDVDFTPIFNARMKNVVLSQQQQEEYQPTAQPILLPIQQEAMPQMQVKGGRSGLQSRFTSGSGIMSEMPVYEQFNQQFQQPALSSGLQWNTDALESRYNPYMGVQGIQGTQGVQSNPGFQSLGSGFSALGLADLDTNEIQARTALGAGSDSGDFDYTSLHIGAADTPSTYSLSSFDASLPNVPATNKNLVKLGVSQPLKFKNVLNVCLQQSADNMACKQVFKAAKLLMKSPVASDIFRSNQ